MSNSVSRLSELIKPTQIDYLEEFRKAASIQIEPLNTAKAALEASQKYTFLSPSELGFYNPLESIRSHVLERANILSLNISPTSLAISSLSETMAQTSFIGKNFNIDGITSISKDWQRILENIGDIHKIALPTYPNAHLLRITEISLLSQSYLADLKFDSIGLNLQVANEIRSSFGSKFLDFSTSYNELFKSYKVPATSIFSLPPSLTELPAIEFFNGVDLVRTTTDEELIEYEEEQNLIRSEIKLVVTDKLEQRLAQVNPDLINLREGAKQAFSSSNLDRKRHCITSLRELVREVMHHLSPDNQIKSWSTSPDDYSDNRPTRAARLRFISRKINHGPFQEFVKKDIAAISAAIQLFQAGTHTVNCNFTDAQLNALIARVETFLLFLFDIADYQEE